MKPVNDQSAECLEKYTDSKEGGRALARAKTRAAGKGKNVPTVAYWDADWTPSAAVIYELYVRWCAANGVPAVSHPQLSKELALGKPQVRNVDGKNARCYVGLRIRV